MADTIKIKAPDLEQKIVVSIQGEEKLQAFARTLNRISKINVGKTSLSNLATYLPQIAAVNTGRLEKLSKIDLSGFNNLKVNKASVDNITRLAEALNTLKDAEKTLGKTRESTKQSSNLTSEMKAELEILKDMASKLKSTFKGSLSGGNMIKDADKLDEIKGKYASLLQQIKDVDAADIENVKTLQGKTLELQREITTLQEVQKQSRSTASSEASDYENITSAMKAEMETLKDMEAKLKSTFKSSLSGSNMIEDPVKLDEIKAKYVDLLQQIKDVNATDIESIKTLQAKTLELQREITAYQEIQKQSRVTAASVSEDQDELKIGSKEYATALAKINSLMTKLQRMKGWTSAQYGDASEQYRNLDGYIEHLSSVYSKLTNSQYTSDTLNTELSAIASNVKAAEGAIRSADEASTSWFGRLGKLSAKFTTWFSVTRVIMTAVRLIRQMVKNVFELDSAMAQLKIVTGATDSQMTKFLSNATALAKELGQSITDVLGSIETFSRLGYVLEDASKLAEYAGILANVANVDTKSAETGLTSIIKGYNLQVSDAEHVADVLVEVGQKYAVSAEELMEAFNRSGAALNATNLSFEKSAGLIAAANASVQDSSTVGTALKTVSARIRGSVTDLEELGENTEELAQGFSKYADEIKALTGFDIRIDGTLDSYKDLFDIFNGISQAWDNLSDTQQARVAEILGGTRQLQVISSILVNWKDAANAYDDAMNSAGVSTKANSIYMETAEAKLNSMKAAFQELSGTILDSDTFGTLIDAGTASLETLNLIFKAFNTIFSTVPGKIVLTTTALLALGAAVSKLKKLETVNKTIGFFKDLSSA